MPTARCRCRNCRGASASITSPTGAALRDVLIALRRRFPATAVLIYPTAGAGLGLGRRHLRARWRSADKRADCDVLILTRGGGSLEDLWSFNEEIVARAIAAVQLPIIVGVGHEIDFTIADFVADLRAPTPSQAAELAVPDQRRMAHAVRVVSRSGSRRRCGASSTAERRQLVTLEHRLARCHPGVQLREREQRLDELEARLARSVERRIAQLKIRLARLATAVAHTNPARRLAAARERWRTAQGDLRRALLRRLELTGQRLKLADRALQSLSPLATLQRGYAIVMDDGGRC